MARTLKPAAYWCSEHTKDLTPDVEDMVNTIYPVSSTGSALRNESQPLRKEKTFAVVVTCPGAKSDAEHDLSFTGTYS